MNRDRAGSVQSRTIGALGLRDLARRLRRDGLRLKIGDIIADIATSDPAVADHLNRLYPYYHIADDDIPDFYLRLRRSPPWRRPFARQVHVDVDSPSPINPLPAGLSPLGFEIGLNWLMAARNDRYLTCHAAVVGSDDAAVMMPGGSGSGKSTLAAVMMLNGWRLLSDEFGLVCPKTGLLAGYPRPVSLKNEAIPVIEKRRPDDHALSGELRGTPKGTIRYLSVTQDSVVQAGNLLPCRVIAFPEYGADGPACQPQPISKAEAFIRLVNGATNYERLGVIGFQRLADLIRQCEIYVLQFADTDAAAHWLTTKLSGRALGENDNDFRRAE